MYANYEDQFEQWLTTKTPLRPSTVYNYLWAIPIITNFIVQNSLYDKAIFEIDSSEEAKQVLKLLKENKDFLEINEKGHGACFAGLNQYIKFLQYRERRQRFIDKPHQRIFFGAPGTGKSYQLNKEAEEYFGMNVERVTFHPNYMYGNFVGAFKPFPEPTGEVYPNGMEKRVISYKYIPGPVMRLLVKAFSHPDENFLLIIEEINRANTAAVFGDFFQLLDRKDDGSSEYPITASEEVKLYLEDAFNTLKKDERNDIYAQIGEDCQRLVLPGNLYIWATMNSADQGVMPMDTAFRRRWEFTYIGIDDPLNDPVIREEFEHYKFKISPHDEVLWNDFRTEVNHRLSECNIPEDKMMGPYFISKSILSSKDVDAITGTIRNKVLMYLYEDAGKAHRNAIFVPEKSRTYSSLCRNFIENGKAVFRKPLELKTYPIADGKQVTDNSYDMEQVMKDSHSNLGAADNLFESD